MYAKSGSSLFIVTFPAEGDIHNVYGSSNSIPKRTSVPIINVETSFGTDGLPAAVRHLTTLSQSCLDIFNLRKEVIVKMGKSEIEEINPIEEMKKDENEEK